MGVCKVTAVLYERKRALSAEKAGNRSRKPAAPANHRDGLKPTGPGPVNDSGGVSASGKVGSMKAAPNWRTTDIMLGMEPGGESGTLSPYKSRPLSAETNRQARRSGYSSRQKEAEACDVVRVDAGGNWNAPRHS